MTGEVVATWTGAAVALAAAALATWQAARANRAAHRSADADERAAAAAERANEFAEQQAAKYVPGWQLSWVSGDRFALTNGSDEDAMEVTVRAEVDGAFFARFPEEPEDLAAREALTFVALRKGNHPGDRRLLVTWRRPNEVEPRTWRGPLPGKPA